MIASLSTSQKRSRFKVENATYGAVSAARMMISLVPLFKDFVASFAPFLS